MSAALGLNSTLGAKMKARHLCFLLLLAASSPHTHAFEFMGVKSGQSQEAVTAALTKGGFKVKRESAKDLTFSSPSESGWAIFCNSQLAQMSVTKPYSAFPALLQAATQEYGPGDLKVAPTGTNPAEHYVTHFWPLGSEAYSLTLVASKAAAPAEVRVAKGIIKGCW